MPVLTPAQRAFLLRQRVAHLATATPQGKPHVIPICFALDAERLVSVIDHKPKRVGPLELRRIRNILANPQVAVVADLYADDWTQLAHLLLDCHAELLGPGEPHTRALVLLRERYPQYRTMDLAERPILSLTIERATGWGRLE